MKKSKQKIIKLPLEIEKIIFQYTNFTCHSCKKMFNSLDELLSIYKKQKKFLFCSLECYNFF